MTGEPPVPGRDGGAAASPAEPAAAGWRWESYGGVDIQVPHDWGYGTTGFPHCLDTDDVARPGRGTVGRPGAIPAIACAEPVAPLGKRRAYVWFDSGAEAGVHEYDGGWVQETRVVRGLALTVFSDEAAARARILDSARPTPAGDGCPVEHPVTTGPDARPDPGPGGLAAMGPVESITVCRYALGNLPRSAASPVLSRSRRSGEDARAAVRAILDAPAGTGPNRPEDCSPEVAHGDEVLLLTVRDDTRTQEVFVRYSGCDGHGIDDGHTHRRLTTDTLTPLLSGPHQPSALHDAVADLVWH